MADDETPDPELATAVESALEPARHDAVMAVWQRVVLGRLDRGEPRSDEQERLRRLRDDEPPPEPPA